MWCAGGPRYHPGMATPSVPSSGSKSKGAAASYPKARGGAGVRATSSKGGHNPTGTTHCEAKRAASNVKQVY